MTPQLICLLGAECTGKTTLTQALAAHYGALWVPEYLRVFCDQHGRTPTSRQRSSVRFSLHATTSISNALAMAATREP